MGGVCVGGGVFGVEHAEVVLSAGEGGGGGGGVGAFAGGWTVGRSASWMIGGDEEGLVSV